MKKFFRTVAGVKFYCDEKGAFTKNEKDELEPVPAEDTEAEEVDTSDEEVTDEVAKMLEKAFAQAKTGASADLAAAEVKATTSFTKLFEALGGFAAKTTKVALEGESKATIDLEKVKKGIKDLREHNSKGFSFEIKTRADLEMLTKVTSEGGSLTDVTLPMAPGTVVEREPQRQPFIEQIADVIPNMTSESLAYVEVTSESGAPAITAELALIPQKDYTFAEFKAPLKKIAVINKHSVELLQDAPQLVAAIKTMLEDDVNLVMDTQLLSGNGTGDNLTGVLTVAAELDATAIGDKRVADANLYDVIRVMLTKVAVSGKGKFIANYVLLNPEDADALDLTKDANGQYVLPPFRSADGTTVKGARIIENIGVPEGTVLVGDFRKLHIGTKGGVEIELTDSDGDDFSHDILSVKLRRRVAAYVRQNDNGAFWVADIADAVAALTAS